MKKKTFSQNLMVSETYVPTPLPKYGMNLDGFITGDYSMLSRGTIREFYHECERNMEELIASGVDKFTNGSILDAWVDGQIEHLLCSHRAEVAAHDLQIANIKAARETRKVVLIQRKNQLEQLASDLLREIDPLKGLHAQFEVRCGNRFLSLGVLVTLLSMTIDALLNFSYLQSILYTSTSLLFVTVLAMSIASDASMMCIGKLLSLKNENFMDRFVYRLLIGGLSALFLLSVVASVLIRFGSMDLTYGAYTSSGVFIGKDTFSLAEWGVSLATAFLTTCTGLISLATSVDHNAHLVNRRRTLEYSFPSQ